MSEHGETFSSHQPAAAGFFAAVVLVTMLGASGAALADHAYDHLASSAAPESGFDLLKALGQPTDDDVVEFLNPEIAFMLSTDARDAYKVVARFDIADGYYLYRDRFNFAVSGAPSVVLDFAQLPDGKEKEDPYFGRTQVYYSSVEAVLQVQRGTTGPVPLTLEVGYQGCADAGLCYPPMKQSVTLTLPATPIQ